MGLSINEASALVGLAVFIDINCRRSGGWQYGVPVHAGDESGAMQLQSAAGCEAAEVPLDERAAGDQAERQCGAGNVDFAGIAGGARWWRLCYCWGSCR